MGPSPTVTRKFVGGVFIFVRRLSAVYGVEEDGRYVTESRLKKMLSHEVNLIEKRLSRENIPIKCFLVMPIQLQLSILPNNLKVTVGLELVTN
jgi:hypothetical protein